MFFTMSGRQQGKEDAEKYNIRVIPTQVFLDKDGKEYFRHEGYFPKEDLVKVIKMQGVKVMIVELFTWLSGALTQSPEIAIGAAFIWGVLSVILSPCHIACIPLIVGFIDGQGNISTGRAFGLSFLFGLGILITIGIIGLITGLAGRMIGDIGGYGNYFVAVIFFAVGSQFAGGFAASFYGRRRQSQL